MAVDKTGRLPKGTVGRREASAPPPYTPHGCLNKCYIPNVEVDNSFVRHRGKSNSTTDNNIDTSGVVRREGSTQRKTKNKKSKKDRNSWLACMADCFCPLYSVKRDFVDYMYTPAATNSPRHAGKVSAGYGGDFAADVNMDSYVPYKGCYYFDNLAVDGQ